MEYDRREPGSILGLGVDACGGAAALFCGDGMWCRVGAEEEFGGARDGGVDEGGAVRRGFGNLDVLEGSGGTGERCGENRKMDVLACRS